MREHDFNINAMYDVLEKKDGGGYPSASGYELVMAKAAEAYTGSPANDWNKAYAASTARAISTRFINVAEDFIYGDGLTGKILDSFIRLAAEGNVDVVRHAALETVWQLSRMSAPEQRRGIAQAIGAYEAEHHDRLAANPAAYNDFLALNARLVHSIYERDDLVAALYQRLGGYVDNMAPGTEHETLDAYANAGLYLGHDTEVYEKIAIDRDLPEDAAAMAALAHFARRNMGAEMREGLEQYFLDACTSPDDMVKLAGARGLVRLAQLQEPQDGSFHLKALAALAQPIKEETPASLRAAIAQQAELVVRNMPEGFSGHVTRDDFLKPIRGIKSPGRLLSQFNGLFAGSYPGYLRSTLEDAALSVHHRDSELQSRKSGTRHAVNITRNRVRF